MSRTRRRVTEHIFRRPSRNVMARDLDQVRPGAVPPDAFEDLHISGDQQAFDKTLRRLVSAGKSQRQIVSQLTRRFRVSARFVLEAISARASN